MRPQELYGCSHLISEGGKPGSELKRN
jgi:hypothetical protein